MAEVAKDCHPDFTLHDVGSPTIQGQRVRRGADGGRPNDVALHLHAFRGRDGRGRPSDGPGGSAAAAEAGQQLVPEFPGSPVQAFAEAVGPLEAEDPLGFLILALRFRLDGLVVPVGKAVLRFLNHLGELFAQLRAQFFVWKTVFPPDLQLLLVPGLGSL